MYRILATVGIWIVLLGGVGLFVHLTEQDVVRAQVVFAATEQDCVLELTATAALGGGDPFAIQAAQTHGAIRKAGEEVAKVESLLAGQTVAVPLQLTVLEGDNELSIELPASYLDQPVAVRAVLRRGAQVLAEQTEWFAPGESYVFVVRWHDRLTGGGEHGH